MKVPVISLGSWDITGVIKQSSVQDAVKSALEFLDKES
jgi:hypothetical protein